ncbi:MAG: Fe-only nitrogenase accessory AnfO family protein [Methanomassiliicoccus sp.]|nr:Fe-only nitrogenase accessory AnfO family protein [Methanomassiliicoccus sp.]
MCERAIPEVASLTGSDGSTVQLNWPGIVVVHRRVRGKWTKDREMPFLIDSGKGLVEMRTKCTELIKFLGSCKIFVARNASGVLFFELEKAHVNVYEIKGTPSDFLEQVWSEDEKDCDETISPATMPVPLERSPGNYYISIKEAQSKQPEFSSKQILQAFVRRGKFATLEVVCDHVPPWIELESRTVGFRLDPKKTGPGEVHLMLTKT